MILISNFKLCQKHFYKFYIKFRNQSPKNTYKGHWHQISGLRENPQENTWNFNWSNFCSHRLCRHSVRDCISKMWAFIHSHFSDCRLCIQTLLIHTLHSANLLTLSVMTLSGAMLYQTTTQNWGVAIDTPRVLNTFLSHWDIVCLLIPSTSLCDLLTMN